MKHELNITNGEWSSKETYDTKYNQNIIEIGVEEQSEGFVSVFTWGIPKDEYTLIGNIICDAGNTYQSCGLIPSQLLKQRDELLNMLKIVAISPAYDECKKLYGHHDNHWTNRLSETLKNCE